MSGVYVDPREDVRREVAQQGQSPDGDRSAATVPAGTRPQAAGAMTNPAAGAAGVAPGAPNNAATDAAGGVATGNTGFKSTAYWGSGDPYQLPNATPMGVDGKPIADIAAYVTPIEHQQPFISTLRAKNSVAPGAPHDGTTNAAANAATNAAADAAQMQYSRLLDEQIAAMAKQRDALNDEDDARRQRRERYENRQRMAAAIVDGLTSLANVGGAYYGATPIQINQNATHLANVNRGIQQLAAQRQQIRDHRSKIDQRLTELLVKRAELAQDYSKSRNEDARKDAELDLKRNKDAREQAAEGRAVDLHPMAVKAAGLENDYTQIKIDYEKELLKWLPKEKATSIASALASKTLSNARANQIKNGTMRVEFDGGGNLKKEVYTVPSDGEYKAN